MRLAPILVPLGFAFAVTGGILIYASIQPAKASPAPAISNEPRHPVTEEMIRSTGDMSSKAAPFFKLKDAHGIEVQLGGAGPRPQFVYFILDGCPCSIDVQPFFNRFYKRYKDKVDFIGVINTGVAKAKDYAGTTTLLHPLVCDEDLKIVDAYGAKESTYSVLVNRDGTIERMWPGYSQDILREMNSRLAKLAGVKEEPFDVAYAPKQKSSGCFFSTAK
jgi:peroxiredoxin